MSDSLWPYGLYSPWNSPGQNTGVGSLLLLQGNSPNPGIKPRSPTLQMDCLPTEPQGKPTNRSRYAFPSPADLPDTGIEPGSPELQVNYLPTEVWGKPWNSIVFLNIFLIGFQRHKFMGGAPFWCRIWDLGYLIWRSNHLLPRENNCSFVILPIWGLPWTECWFSFGKSISLLFYPPRYCLFLFCCEDTAYPDFRSISGELIHM